MAARRIKYRLSSIRARSATVQARTQRRIVERNRNSQFSLPFQTSWIATTTYQSRKRSKARGLLRKIDRRSSMTITLLRNWIWVRRCWRMSTILVRIRSARNPVSTSPRSLMVASTRLAKLSLIRPVRLNWLEASLKDSTQMAKSRFKSNLFLPVPMIRSMRKTCTKIMSLPKTTWMTLGKRQLA